MTSGAQAKNWLNVVPGIAEFMPAFFHARPGAHLGAEVEIPDVERDATLREMLVSHLEQAGVLHVPAVSAALRAVPRHRFLPGTPLEHAYADRAVAIKTRGDEIVSSVSQPAMIAQMLELLAPAPGDRVLEIGTGSGYNAALLAEIVGRTGSVTTLDLDAELVGRARIVLDETGYAAVRVLAADGAVGARAEEAQYDRVIVTARTDDVPTAWWQALRDGARLVVPLRLEGAGEFAVGFERRAARLESVGLHPCAFIALRGETAATSASSIFYRDPAARPGPACVRNVAGIVAVRREDATPELLREADVVIARPVSLFAVRF